MKKKLFFTAIFFIASISVYAQNKPAISQVDRIRIAEAYQIGEKLQNSLWANWDKAPFALLLIDEDNEFLIRHPKPSDEFQSIGYDNLLKSEIYVRPRKFDKSFLATFPAFGTPLIVVGKAENTFVKTSTPWVFTILHEHFHQMQTSQPTYFADVNALNISRGDETGMWQLNYAFPYDKQEIGEKFKALSASLLDTYKTTNKREQAAKLNNYLSERKRFAEMFTPDDYKYFSFQLWQEGIARYTEYKMTELAARKMKPSKEFKALKDFTPFEAEAKNLLDKTTSEMQAIDLAKSQRIVFYPFGAFEGLLLDKINPKWRDEYFTKKFALEDFYQPKN